MNIFNVEIEEFWLDFEGSHWVIKQTSLSVILV